MPLQRLRGAGSISILDPERCTVEAYQVFRESQFWEIGAGAPNRRAVSVSCLFWCAFSGAGGCNRGVRGLLP